MSALSSPLQAVVGLFSGPLQGVRFADIDGDGLATLAAEVETLSDEVEAQEAQLASLRESLALKQETLLALAQQALAYARIYAESDEALSVELNEIALPRATKPRKGASVKSSSERGTKTSKDDVDSSAEEGAEVQAQEAEPAPLAMPKRKGSAAGAVAEAVLAVAQRQEKAVAPKGARRKLPAHSGRASR